MLIPGTLMRNSKTVEKSELPSDGVGAKDDDFTETGSDVAVEGCEFTLLR